MATSINTFAGYMMVYGLRLAMFLPHFSSFLILAVSSLILAVSLQLIASYPHIKRPVRAKHAFYISIVVNICAY